MAAGMRSTMKKAVRQVRDGLQGNIGYYVCR